MEAELDVIERMRASGDPDLRRAADLVECYARAYKGAFEFSATVGGEVVPSIYRLNFEHEASAKHFMTCMRALALGVDTNEQGNVETSRDRARDDARHRMDTNAAGANGSVSPGQRGRGLVRSKRRRR